VDATEEARERMAALGSSLGPARAEVWLEELLLCRERIHTLNSHGRSILESTLLALARAEDTLPLSELVSRLTALEAKLPDAPMDAAPPTPRSAPSRPDPSPEVPDKAVLEPQAPPEPERPSGGARKRTEADRRAARSSATEAWSAFLEDLEGSAQALGEVIRSKTRLISLEEARVVLRATKLLDEEKALLEDKRNQRTLSKVFSTVLGRELTIEIEDADSLRPGAEDPYTKQVADLFDGQIED
jgi:hypothetical protein